MESRKETTMAIESSAMSEAEAADAVPADEDPHLGLLALERERLRRERDEARAQARALTAANRQMDEFLGVATHELRSPVTSGFLGVRLAAQRLDALLDQTPGSEAEVAGQLASVQGLLARAEEGLDRLTRVVVDLLDLSRIGAGQLDLHPACCDLTAIVREAVEEQRQLAPARLLRLHLPARKTAPVWADADRIGQVVTNYLTNALKYSEADRPVDVRVQVREGWARVAVQDRGPGLSAEERRRIWERFHRVAGVPAVGDIERGQGPGLGLGLHICRSIIEQHHGHVGVRSMRGGGSTFWFALPALRLDC
jgi:signal transduction histidine kinase